MFKILMTFALFLTYSLGHSRGPAVEEFVGIETENYREVPAGQEALYNFDQELKKVENATKLETWPYFLIAAFLLLPMGIWFAVSRKRSSRVQAQNMDNVIEFKQKPEQKKKAS